LAEDDCDRKTDGSDIDDTGAEDESFDAQTKLKVNIAIHKEVILREHKVNAEKEAPTTPTATVKKRKVTTTQSTATPLPQKHLARTPSSNDSNKILKNIEDSL
jgi:hypothetical protein